MSTVTEAREIDRHIALTVHEAVRAERDRVYGLFLSTPWITDPGGEDTEETRAVKADRFNLMMLVRDGVASYTEHPMREMFERDHP